MGVKKWYHTEPLVQAVFAWGERGEAGRGTAYLGLKPTKYLKREQKKKFTFTPTPSPSSSSDNIIGSTTSHQSSNTTSYNLPSLQYSIQLPNMNTAAFRRERVRPDTMSVLFAVRGGAMLEHNQPHHTRSDHMRIWPKTSRGLGAPAKSKRRAAPQTLPSSPVTTSPATRDAPRTMRVLNPKTVAAPDRASTPLAQWNRAAPRRTSKTHRRRFINLFAPTKPEPAPPECAIRPLMKRRKQFTYHPASSETFNTTGYDPLLPTLQRLYADKMRRD